MLLDHALQIAFLFSHLHLVRSAETQSTNVTIHGSCNFAKPTFPFPNEMSVYTMFPESRGLLKLLFCNVWYNSSEGILRLWLQKTSYSVQTSLLSTVLDQHGSLVLPGFVRAAEEHVAYPFHICPAVNESSSRNYSIFLSAPPKTGINLTVQVDESILSEGQMKTLQFGYKISSRLLVFDISSVRGIYDHFLVTVRSDDRLQECLLIVSTKCSDVVNIDPEAINFKKSGSALHLSFTTFGRITLSHASRPQLSTGRWFLGVFLKRPRSSRDPSVSKTVDVSVGFVGGVDRISFTAPVAYLILISSIGGLLIAVFAECFFNPEVEHRLIHNIRQNINSRIFSVTVGKDQVDAYDPEMNYDIPDAEASRMNETRGRIMSSTPSVCMSIHDGQNGPSASSTTTTPYDISKLSVPQHWPGFKNWGRVFRLWFHDEENAFAYTTTIAAFSLLTGAAQFIVSNWRNMKESGNRDICYYNEGCYRTTTEADLPYNLIISNLCYVIHGTILAISVSLREATYRTNAEVRGTRLEKSQKNSFSVAYAFAWALVFEGIFSAFYHMCPSRMTFQFDSAFMFVICGLVVVAVFNSRAEKPQQQEGSQDQCECGTVAPIRDTKLFLFFVVPLLLLNYLGSIRDTEGFLLFPDWVFYCLTILWIVSMFLWAFYRLMLPWKPTPGPSFWCKFSWLCIVFPFILLFIGLYTVDVKKDWSRFFLFTCLMAVITSVIGYLFSNCARNIYNRTARRRDMTRGERNDLQLKMYFKWPLVNFHVVLYMICIAVCWVLALHYFYNKGVTDKVKLPSRSREFNQECVLWQFFDYHDLWHIISSFALLQTAYLLLWSIG